jgi:acyl carrier protein
MGDTDAQLIRLIATVTDLSADSITPASRFDELAGWSSLIALRLLTAAEDHFQLRLNLADYLRVDTVSALAAAIASGVPRPQQKGAARP